MLLLSPTLLLTNIQNAYCSPLPMSREFIVFLRCYECNKKHLLCVSSCCLLFAWAQWNYSWLILHYNEPYLNNEVFFFCYSIQHRSVYGTAYCRWTMFLSSYPSAFPSHPGHMPTTWQSPSGSWPHPIWQISRKSPIDPCLVESKKPLSTLPT